jgi:cytochrome c oxidase subunit I+III
MGLGTALFLVNVFWSRTKGRVAGTNPWNAPTLEWATPSPVPVYNYIHLPTVRGRDALWDEFDKAPVVTGTNNQVREVLTTSLMEAHPQHTYELAGDSIWPLCLALAAGGSFIGAIFTPWSIPIGAALSGLVLGLWFWRGNEPFGITERGAKHPENPPSLAELAKGGAA